MGTLVPRRSFAQLASAFSLNLLPIITLRKSARNYNRTGGTLGISFSPLQENEWPSKYPYAFSLVVGGPRYAVISGGGGNLIK